MPTYRWEKWVEDSNGGIIKYRASYGTEFEVDGDSKKELEIIYHGSYESKKEYVLHRMRDMLRKLENGQIKAFSGSSRDWKQEEEIKEELWKDIARGFPSRESHVEYACGLAIQTQTMEVRRRSPSPTCKIS